MAMTKKEQAEFEAMREARDLARAMRWPEYARPEMIPAPRNSGEPDTSGWVYNAAIDWSNRWCLPDKAWSSSYSHGGGAQQDPKRTATQNGIPLYASRLDALKGLRLELTERFARILSEIDAEIAKEG